MQAGILPGAEIQCDDEIEAILTYIKSTWPERERAYQKQITQQSKVQSTE